MEPINESFQECADEKKQAELECIQEFERKRNKALVQASYAREAKEMATTKGTLQEKVKEAEAIQAAMDLRTVFDRAMGVFSLAPKTIVATVAAALMTWTTPGNDVASALFHVVSKWFGGK
jgi:hypothetical protein